MKSLQIAVISSLLYLVFPYASAQLISVKSQMASDSMMIGDQVVFTIHVEALENVSFQFPNVTDTLSKDIEVLFPISSDTMVIEGRKAVDQSYMITSFEAGIQLVPPQPVIYSTGDIIDTAMSMPLLIRVFEPVVDTTQQIKPIKPPMNTPLTFKEVLPWLAVAMGGWMVVTLIFALVWMYRQRQKDPEIFSLKPQEPAHVIAFRELDRLKEEKIWEKGRVKHYYTRLTKIFRRYIESQYGIPAMERTTEEILHAFRKSNTEDDLLDEMLKELLELADLVKFAKEDPLPVENQTNLNNAYLFVQKSYPLFFKEDPGQKEEEPGDE
ncbi:MAG: hypothetical protein ABFS38_10325 [Bacteroidota bacterium]